MGYKIHTNKTTKHKQNIEFMGENDYETLEILILNIALSTHLNKKNLSNDIDLPSRVNPYFFPIFYGHCTDNSRDSHYALSEEEE
jgi:hypothetical protein